MEELNSKYYCKVREKISPNSNIARDNFHFKSQE
ncbi:hypothetical protein DAI22_07g127250 [Oryza sativa Japonica Group]|nr:hypothetical protein DAI22_07g127250 [Oryza sativa Japonica Group]